MSEKNSKYWKKRIIKLEGDKEARAEKLAKKTAKAYRRAYRQIVSEINALYAEMLDKGIENPMRSDIYNLNRYKSVSDQIARQTEDLAIADIENLGDLLDSISFETYSSNLKQFGVAFSVLDRRIVESIARTDWTGATFSTRIWGNADHFRQRVVNDIEMLVVAGKSPEKLKKELMKDYTAKFHEADRLIRTEASHAFNTAAIESYKKAGCQYIDYLAEPDCCDICEQYRGKRYEASEVPVIPVHPNCRCTYLPVIDL